MLKTVPRSPWWYCFALRVCRLWPLPLSALLVTISLCARPQQAPRELPRPLRLAFIGDILLEAPWQHPPLPPAELFANVRARLTAADLVVGNLEQPLTDWLQPTPHKNPALVAAGRDFIFRATSPDAARALRDAGLRVAALANNHTMDYTERGLLDTVERLRAAGIVAVGGGENQDEAEQVRVVELAGWRLGFLAFSDVVPFNYQAEPDRPGIASSKDPTRVQRAIARARPSVDFLAVIFHWGKEGTHQPTRRQQNLARAARRAGADLILGAHPHRLQGIGCLGRVPVIYSAGNFVFPTRRAAAHRSAIFEIELSRASSISIRVVPLLLDERGAPCLAEGASAHSILNELRRLSAPLGTRFEGGIASCP